MRSVPGGRRMRRLATALTLPLVIGLTSLPAFADPSPQTTEIAPDRLPSTEQNGVALMRIVVPDQTGLDRLAALDVDLAEYTKPVDGGIEVHAVLSPQEAQSLRDQGFDVRDVISDQSDFAENQAERRQALASAQAAVQEADTLTPLRAEWFTSLDDQRFLSVEVKTSATDAQTVLTVTWDAAPPRCPASPTPGSTCTTGSTPRCPSTPHPPRSPSPATAAARSPCR